MADPRDPRRTDTKSGSSAGKWIGYIIGAIIILALLGWLLGWFGGTETTAITEEPAAVTETEVGEPGGLATEGAETAEPVELEADEPVTAPQ